MDKEMRKLRDELAEKTVKLGITYISPEDAYETSFKLGFNEGVAAENDRLKPVIEAEMNDECYMCEERKYILKKAGINE